MVAEAFLPERPGGHICRHLNGIRTDNRAANLAWGTHAENTADAIRHGTWNPSRPGVMNGSAKLGPADVLVIRILIGHGYSQRRIARCYGVSDSLITAIKYGRVWAK